jgi:hypothetical protein
MQVTIHEAETQLSRLIAAAERGEEVGRLNGILRGEHADPEIDTRIAQYEMAFRMQSSVPDLTDMRDESQATLVIWGGEFGRTPMGQGTGRDHHINAFSLWMAGAGIKPGIVHGETDELGYATVKDTVNVRDLHATLLHQFGIDHSRFSTKFQGLDYRLTGVEPAKPVQAIML